MIQKTLAAICVGITFASSGFADITIVQKLETPAGDKLTGDITIHATATKTRVDMGSEMSTISDDEKKKIVTLIHGQKIAMEMPANLMNQMKAQVASAGTNDLKPESFTPTGRKENINGFECEEYTYSVQGQKVSSWFAKELQEKGDIAAAFKNLAKSSNPMASSLAQLDAMPGVPIRTIIDLPGGGLTTITIEKISTDKIPSSVFAIPAGYKSMGMPTIPGMN